jgi:hypothetical protein
MSQKTIRIMSPRGLTVPAAVLGRSEDLKVSPHQPVIVPEFYGRSLIADRFAVAASGRARRNAAAPTPKPEGDEQPPLV